MILTFLWLIHMDKLYQGLIFMLLFSHVFWCYLVQDLHSIWHTLDLFCIFLFGYWLFYTADWEWFLLKVIWIFGGFQVWINPLTDR